MNFSWFPWFFMDFHTFPCILPGSGTRMFSNSLHVDINGNPWTSMEIHENHWKLQKIDENPRKYDNQCTECMKFNRNPWKSMEIQATLVNSEQRIANPSSAGRTSNFPDNVRWPRPANSELRQNYCQGHGQRRANFSKSLVNSFQANKTKSNFQ